MRREPAQQIPGIRFAIGTLRDEVREQLWIHGLATLAHLAGSQGEQSPRVAGLGHHHRGLSQRGAVEQHGGLSQESAVYEAEAGAAGSDFFLHAHDVSQKAREIAVAAPWIAA